MTQRAHTTILLQPEGIKIPASLPSLDTFRRWAHSGEFPDRGRIDWIAGQVEVDMSAEDLNTHGTVKGAISRELGLLIESRDLGVVLIDRFRLVSVAADLSVEPDVLVLLRKSLDAGRVRLVSQAPAARSRRGPRGRTSKGTDAAFPRVMEVEGAADLVVECVSDSSERKDLERLPARYFRAGVKEFWRVDARKDPIAFDLFRRGRGGWIGRLPDREGYRRSEVLGAAVRLKRIPIGSGLVRYQLERRVR